MEPTLCVDTTIGPLPTASVIIPTKNRPRDLELTVASLLVQTTMPQELIIIDQSNDDESQRRVESQFTKAPAPQREAIQLRYIRDVAISGGAQARNRAMDLANGEVLVFLDDDVVLETSFLEELLRPYTTVPELAGVSGMITNYPVPPVWYRVWAGLFMRGPFRDPRQPIYWKADALRHAAPIRVDRFTGALMSFRASVVRTLRFDEGLHGVSEGEDVDFCCRLPAGSRLVICPRARLAHMHSPQGRGRDHGMRRLVLGPHYLYRKNWRHGIVNRFCFVWLNIGCGLLATAAAGRRRSLAPWRALLAGMSEARGVHRRIVRGT